MYELKYNLWRSTYSGVVYKMPIWWKPQYNGWQFIRTVEK